MIRRKQQHYDHAQQKWNRKTLIECNKENFSKVKSPNERNDKMRESANDDWTRNRMFKGELAWEECNDEDVCQFLLLQKTHDGLQEDEEDEM